MFIITHGTHVYRRLIHRVVIVSVYKWTTDSLLVRRPLPLATLVAILTLLTSLSHTKILCRSHRPHQSVSRRYCCTYQDFSDTVQYIRTALGGAGRRADTSTVLYAYLSKQRPSARIPSPLLCVHPLSAHFLTLTPSTLCVVLTSLTHRTHYPRVLTTATSSHVMTSTTDLESGQGGAQDAPHTGVFCSLFHRCPLGSV
jgi:hypothetical protein